MLIFLSAYKTGNFLKVGNIEGYFTCFEKPDFFDYVDQAD
jgi:hypothetical protein